MNLEKVKKNLENRHYQVSLFEDVKEALQYLNEKIDGTTVGIGGSVTVKEMGLFDSLSCHNEVWWHNDEKQVAQYGVSKIRERAKNTKIYISSINGMSASGQLINIDNTGNRIASTLYGHKKVYLIVGINKIEDTFEKALWRARNIAAPKNAKRFGAKTPCAINGDKCYDCNSPERICRSFSILEAPTKGQETEIILINQCLGY